MKDVETQRVLPVARMPSGEAWKAIARLALDLGQIVGNEGRVAWLDAFAKRLWGTTEARYFPINRNLSDMADRPAKGPAAFWEHIAHLGHLVIVTREDLLGHAFSSTLPELISDSRLKSFLIAPVLTPGRAVGVLALADEGDRDFEEDDVERLEAVVAQIASVLDAVTLAEEMTYRISYSRALGDIDMMIASYDITEILRYGVLRILETIDVEKVLVFIVNQETGVLRLSVAEGCQRATEGQLRTEDQLRNEPCARLAHQAQEVRRSRVVSQDEFEDLKRSAAETPCNERAGVVTPIMANNQLYGVLEVLDKRNGRPFHRNEVAFVNQVALKLALVIQNTQAYLTINRLNESLEHKVKDRTIQLEQAITTIQETQAQLMQTEKLATMGTLAGGIAHEINNPLAAILANVQLLRMDIEDEEQLESVGIIEAGAKRCKHIVEGLLNYARAAHPEQRSLSINQIMHDTLDMLGHQLRHANIVVDLQMGDITPVLGVATEIGQVFTNLIVNATDAILELRGPKGPGVLTIRSGQSGRHVWLEVEDDGPGIGDHVLRKIFDPFFTTKEIGKGTGLGLSVSQQIAAALGGHLEARTAAGRGATFRLVLPAASGTGERATGPLQLGGASVTGPLAMPPWLLEPESAGDPSVHQADTEDLAL